jgi:hypothetical protein
MRIIEHHLSKINANALKAFLDSENRRLERLEFVTLSKVLSLTFTKSEEVKIYKLIFLELKILKGQGTE